MARRKQLKHVDNYFLLFLFFTFANPQIKDQVFKKSLLKDERLFYKIELRRLGSYIFADRFVFVFGFNDRLVYC